MMNRGNPKVETGAHASSVWDIRYPCRMPRGKKARQDAPLRTQDACAPGGFTLLELLVVITIIAILAGLILNTAGHIQKEGARSRAKAEIAALEAALESYKAEYGAYPETNSDFASYTGSNGSKLLYNALVLSNSLNPLGKVFFEPNKGILFASNSTSPNNYFVDPFGTSYSYAAGSAATNNGSNFFDLWSTAGSTTATANEPKWIKNW